jgi:26S proteasome regulatory subunit N5
VFPEQLRFRASQTPSLPREREHKKPEEGNTAMETKKEYSAELKEAVPESVRIAGTAGGVEDAIAMLLQLEKKCRAANDFHNLKEVCLHMVRLCREKNDWAKLNSVLSVINKRRSQSKLAIEAVVREAYTYLEQCPTVVIKTDLATTLKEVVEGKIYVEAESARLHLLLARILEEQKDIAGACAMIQDVHVETYGSLSKLEKAEYILEQIRLNLLKNDYVRTLIQSRKMNLKVLGETGFEKVKVAFNTLMIEYWTHEKDTWEISQCYYNIYSATSKDDQAAMVSALESSVIFLLLSKHDNHQSDMMHRLKLLPDAGDNAMCKHVLELFTTKEIIPYPFDRQELLQSHACFVKPFITTEAADELKKNFHVRVTQHNLRVCAG